MALMLFGAMPRSFGRHDPELFVAVAALYFVFGVASSFSIEWRRPAFSVQVVGQTFVDIVVITVMMFASGGVGSGFGMLLVVAIAGGSILTVGRTAILFAAIAALAVLAQEVYAWLHSEFQETAYTQSGILGATFFATAFLAHVLAERIRESEALALQRGLDLANLSVLNEHIIQRMQSGIVAVDSQDRVRLINGSGKRLLGIGGQAVDEPLAAVSQELAQLTAGWRESTASGSRVFKPAGAGSDVIASFAVLEQPNSHGALIFLEDSSEVTDRAQRLKLASLGRLTASIAHEVRNPLGAISHAGQLLAESPELSDPDRRLTRIIREQSQRVNGIIQNVLQLSRREPPSLERFSLGPWLAEFVEDFTNAKGIESKDLVVKVANEDVQVRFDPLQLSQVLTNLCENALRYRTGRPSVTLRGDILRDTGRPFLDVCDRGPGVDDESIKHLFEPFFTTEREGTGLGLYIAREVCELNHASLNHLGQTNYGHCFRITFAHPKRQVIGSA